MARKNTQKTDRMEIRVQLRNSGNWGIQKNGNKNPSAVRTTQREAIKIASIMARKFDAELVIYNRAGEVRRRYYK